MRHCARGCARQRALALTRASRKSRPQDWMTLSPDADSGTPVQSAPVPLVLFVSRLNTAASIMAEAILRHLARDRLRVASTGASGIPCAVSPHAIECLQAHGIPAPLVLFLCRSNTTLSIMAEAMLRHLAQGRVNTGAKSYAGALATPASVSALPVAVHQHVGSLRGHTTPIMLSLSYDVIHM